MERETPSAPAGASDSLRVAPNVHNGTYTIDHAERGHFTVKLHTVQKGNLAGKRILSLLIGPDNQRDFQGCAFWDDDSRVVRVWKRFRGAETRMRVDGFSWSDGWSAYEKKLAIWCDLAVRGSTEDRRGYQFGEGYRLLLEGRCVVCNRKLTEPESIRIGVGPVCRGGS